MTARSLFLLVCALGLALSAGACSDDSSDRSGASGGAGATAGGSGGSGATGSTATGGATISGGGGDTAGSATSSSSTGASGASTGGAGGSSSGGSTGAGGSSGGAAGHTGTAGAAGAGTGGTAGAGTGGSAGSGGSGNPIHTVFVILMENHNWDQITGDQAATYINRTILPMSSYATNYKGPVYKGNTVHPSEPNYIWLEAGTNHDLANGAGRTSFTTDNDPSATNQSTSNQHLVSLLNAAGISWKAYVENIDAGVCPLKSSGLFAAKHTPMLFFTDVTSNAGFCASHVVPFSELATDLASAATMPRYAFITPNLCNDMHNSTGCASSDSIVNGDTWLRDNLPTILKSQAYRDGGAVFISWDESEIALNCVLSNCPIGMIVLSPRAKGGGYHNSIAYDHSSTLKTIEEIFGVTPMLGAAANATDLSDLFASFP